MLHDSYSDLLAVLVSATSAYVWLVALLRISGKRTLAQLNAFDFIVTVALGSMLASVTLSGSVSWSEGALGLAVLAGLQFVSAWASTRFTPVRKALTSQPTVLLRGGQMLPEVMKAARVDEDSLRAAVRSGGHGGLESVAAVVLETDGKLSIISTSQLGSGSAMAGLSAEI